MNTPTQQTEEQHETLNEKFDTMERIAAKARVYSVRAETSSSVETQFLACYQFGRTISEGIWVIGEENVNNPTAKELAEKAEVIHNDICNTIVRTFCFTDADSVTCPCNSETDDMDILSCVLSDLSKADGQAGVDMKRLIACLVPLADIFYVVALLEKDAQAIETAQRIKNLINS